MKQFLETLRAVLVSGEVVLLLGIALTWRFWCGVLEFVGERIVESADTGGWQVVIFVPAGLLAPSILMVSKLHEIAESEDHALYEWDEYWRLRIRVWVSVCYVTLGAASSIVLWFGYKVLPVVAVGAVYLGGALISLMSCGTLVLAVFTAKEIVSGARRPCSRGPED